MVCSSKSLDLTSAFSVCVINTRQQLGSGTACCVTTPSQSHRNDNITDGKSRCSTSGYLYLTLPPVYSPLLQISAD